MRNRKKSWRRALEGLLLHICVIFCIACLIFHILDWYNPYMDFMGHADFAQYGLYISVLVLAVARSFDGGKNMKLT